MAMSGVISSEKKVTQDQSLWDFAATVDPNFSNYHTKASYEVFDRPYDHQWYQPYNSKKELQDIKVVSHTTVEKDGRKCNPYDLFTV